MISPKKTTVIVSVYKDVETLGLILLALSRQTVQGFEVLVSEDGNSSVVTDYIRGQVQSITHTSGPDIGWTKNAALDRAVRAARGEYLIFIDGDCIPHSHFVESHLSLAAPGMCVSGRRVDIGPGVADLLRKHLLGIPKLENFLWVAWNYLYLIKDQARALEDGVYVRPGSWFHAHVLAKISKIRGILGCNFACWKKDLESINGFDEDYDSPAVGEDSDLEWRFAHIGVGIKSCRNMAIVYHFRHPLRFDGFSANLEKMTTKINSGKYYCERGLNKL